MKEISDIIRAYEVAAIHGKKTALATVVQVDGSAYRRPGARMLVTEDGELTGAISGGCLEGDALRKAQNVIFQQKAMLVTYDTTDDDDQKFGVGLGCNGIIHILIEPIDADNTYNPIYLLKMTQVKREANVLITAFNLQNKREEQIGTRLLFKREISIPEYDFSDINFLKLLKVDVAEVFNNKHNLTVHYPDVDVFLEYIKPPVQILLFGAGNDTIPLVKMSSLLGMETILIDGRKNYATEQRFPLAKQIIVSKADEALTNLSTDSNTVALLMTHNFEYEAVVLEELLFLSLPYIGILGPKKKTIKLKERLLSKGLHVDKFITNIFAPIGLDLGAETPEEIALSVLAEIQAVLKGKKPKFLKDKPGPIHEEDIRLKQSRHVQ